MKLLRCSCLRAFHDNPAYSGQCPFCKAANNSQVIIDESFAAPLTFLNEIVAKIDKLIEAGNFKDAALMFDEVLEWAPRNSAVYWRRYLVSVGCKNALDVLHKGIFFDDNAAFKNAVKYANADERIAYDLLEKARVRIVRLLEAELTKREKSEKVATDAEKLLADYKNLLNSEERTVAANIAKLEEIERAIREQEMDCSSIVGEYKHALNSIHQDATQTGKSNAAEISLEEKNNWERQLDALQRVSNAEYEKLNQVVASHPAFAEFNRLVGEQKAICNAINANKDNLDRIKSSIEQTVAKMAQITQAFAQARRGIKEGDYSEAEKRISPARFKALIEQAMGVVK